MPAKHIFLGLVNRNGVRVTDAESIGWYHITNLLVTTEGVQGTNAPCAVSLTPEGLPGGDVIDPGGSIDLYGSAVYIGGPVEGSAALVSVELRTAPTFRTVSPIGELTSSITAKAVGVGRKLIPGHWWPIVTNVQCMFGVIVRVTGNGPAWVGTHMNPGPPPDYAGPPPHLQDIANVGGAFPIFPGDPPLHIDGNPIFYAYCYPRTDGIVPDVTLHMLKVARGRTFQKPT